MSHRLAGALAVVALAPACFAGHAPLPPVPAHQRPTLELPPSPPPAGHGRVVLDVVDEHAVVHVVGGTSVMVNGGAAAVHLSRLCATPCAVDLPYGQHELRFSVDRHPRRRGSAIIDVQGDMTFMRSALGESRGGGPISKLGGLIAVVGGVGLLVGGYGLATASGSDLEDAESLSLISLAVTAIGVAIWYLDRPISQDSASTQWR